MQSRLIASYLYTNWEFVLVIAQQNLLEDGLFNKSDDVHRLAKLLGCVHSRPRISFLIPDIPWVMCLEIFYTRI